MFDRKNGEFNSDFPDIDLPNQNIWQLIYPLLKKWGNLTALVGNNEKNHFTYNDLLTKSLCWAKELKKFFKGNVPPRVVFMMPNNEDCIPVIWGCFAIGATLCPIRHDSVKDLVKIQFEHLNPDVIITETSLYDNIHKSLKQLGINPHIYIRGFSPVIGVDDFSKVISSGNTLDAKDAGQFDPGITSMIVYSSGTTGTPKGIVLSHRSQVHAVMTYSSKYFNPICPADVGEQETILCNVPFAHLFGIQYFSIVVPMFGCRIVYLDFKKELLLASHVMNYKPKLLIARPDVVEELAKLDCREVFASVRTIMVAGSPPNSEAFKILNEKLGNKLVFLNCYGSTECGGIAHSPLKQRGLDLMVTLLPNVKAKFIQLYTEKAITDVNQIGEIVIKSSGIMDGYLNNPEATEKAIDSEGWYHTGDIGYFDDDHYFKVIDRFIDLITTVIGEQKMQISPSRIEEILKSHPKVMDAGVVGIPDAATGGQLPKAFVIQNGVVEVEELHKHVLENTPEKLKLTGGIEFLDILPRNHLGKLVRKFLRNMTLYK